MVFRVLMITITLFATIFTSFAAAETDPSQPKVIIYGDPKLIQHDISSYREEVKPGDKKSYPVFFENISNEPASVTFYVSDVRPTIGGGKDFGDPDTEDTLVGTWFKGASAKNIVVKLKPKEIKKITVDLEVPKELEPGQYIGELCIVSDTSMSKGVNLKEGEAGYNVNIRHKSGIQVILDYKETEVTPSYKMTRATYSTVNKKGIIDVYIKDRGTVLVKPQGELKVVTESGSEVLRQNIKMDSIYPTTEAPARIPLNQELPAGRYFVESSLDYQGVKDNSRVELLVNQPELLTVIKDDKGNKQIKVNVPEDKSSKTLLIISVVSSSLLVLMFFTFVMILIKKKKRKIN